MMDSANKRIRAPGRSVAVLLLLLSLGGVGTAGCKKAPPEGPTPSNPMPPAPEPMPEPFPNPDPMPDPDPLPDPIPDPDPNPDPIPPLPQLSGDQPGQ